MKPRVIIIAIAAAIASVTIAAFLDGIGRQPRWGQADDITTTPTDTGAM